MKNSKLGFTLIELLIVIMIIGVLAAIVIGVLNPAEQRTKAREGVMKANLAKICQAVVACQSALSTPNVTNCDTIAEIGVETPTQPTTAAYAITASGTTADADYVQVDATLSDNSCVYRCGVRNDFGVYLGQSPGAVVEIGSNCVSK